MELYEIVAMVVTFAIGLALGKFAGARTAMVIIKALSDGKITSDELKEIVAAIKNPK